MEIEQNTQIVAKKLWNVVRIVFYMLRKGISKSKLILDVHMMLKRGKIAGGEAISKLMLHHHYAALTCRSNDVQMSFISPREYEFSCSNSPVFPVYRHSKRKNHHRHNIQYYKEEEINIAQKVFDILNRYEMAAEASPLALPGFGKSPMVRQLRVTDSPFPVKDFEENSQVDKDAEEFIKKFYRELKQQKKVAAIESPSPYNKWGR